MTDLLTLQPNTACLLWSGPTKKTKRGPLPINDAKEDVRYALFLKHHPHLDLQDTSPRLDIACNNPLCVAPNHTHFAAPRKVLKLLSIPVEHFRKTRHHLLGRVCAPSFTLRWDARHLHSLDSDPTSLLITASDLGTPYATPLAVWSEWIRHSANNTHIPNIHTLQRKLHPPPKRLLIDPSQENPSPPLDKTPRAREP